LGGGSPGFAGFTSTESVDCRQTGCVVVVERRDLEASTWAARDATKSAMTADHDPSETRYLLEGGTAGRCSPAGIKVKGKAYIGICRLERWKMKRITPDEQAVGFAAEKVSRVSRRLIGKRTNFNPGKHTPSGMLLMRSPYILRSCAVATNPPRLAFGSEARATGSVKKARIRRGYQHFSLGQIGCTAVEQSQYMVRVEVCQEHPANVPGHDIGCSQRRASLAEASANAGASTSIDERYAFSIAKDEAVHIELQRWLTPQPQNVPPCLVSINVN
jgi:hypothetical protein